MQKGFKWPPETTLDVQCHMCGQDLIEKPTGWYCKCGLTNILCISDEHKGAVRASLEKYIFLKSVIQPHLAKHQLGVTVWHSDDVGFRIWNRGMESTVVYQDAEEAFIKALEMVDEVLTRR